MSTASGGTNSRPRKRGRRLLATRAVQASLVSLSKLRSVAATNETGRGAGRVADVVVRWNGSDPYPLVTGVVLQIGDRQVFQPVASIVRLDAGGVVVRDLGLDAGGFVRREGELRLVSDFLGRQLVDVDGVKVLRAEDLFLAPVLGRIRLVAVAGEVGHWWARIFAHGRTGRERLVDWSAVHPFGEPGSELRLQVPHEGLRRLHPGELADLLEELDQPARDELTTALDRGAVADALEEMEPERIEDILRDAPPQRAAELVAAMEPDEAVDVLRDMERAEADAILARVPPEVARQLTQLLGYPETMAGGFMTTTLARALATEAVGEVRQHLAELKDHRADIDSVAVLDEAGRLIADIPLFDLLAATDDTPVSDLLGDTTPVTIHPEAFLDEVVDRLTEARASSVVVVGPDGRPMGRVLADDVIDALKEGGLRLKLPWLFH
ncbi:MAG: magnesium transporter [Candidatus Dormibacteraeota bacterium]|nr:magnesium transporter [Candidatus Dormibacteraeota bacterium]